MDKEKALRFMDNMVYALDLIDMANVEIKEDDVDSTLDHMYVYGLEKVLDALQIARECRPHDGGIIITAKYKGHEFTTFKKGMG